MLIKSINPSNNEVLKTFEEFSDKEVTSVIEQANSAFHQWKDTPMTKRSRLMKNVAKILREEAMHYASILTIEMGKLIREGLGFEVEICAQIAEYYAKHGAKFMAPETLQRSFIKGSTKVEKYPIGVLLGIMPWNFPYYQIFRFAVPNIIAGNTVIIKHASNVPQCAQAVEELFRKAGFPEGVYSNVFVSGRNASKIIDDPRIQGVSITGSEGAGIKVAEAAGRNLKKVVLELGGSDPFILLDEADIDYASDLAIMGRFFNCGQACVASKRFIILEKVYEDFLNAFVEKTKAIVPGDPMNPATKYGPMSSEDELIHLLKQIDNAKAQGARIECGGKRIERPGAWMEPTIITGVTREMDIYKEELFGPAAVVYKVKNDQEAIDLANDSDYGLSSVVCSTNTSRAKKVGRQIESGMTFINTVSTTEPNVPFGGNKRSGIGRELSKVGIEEFINKKTVRSIPIWAFKLYMKKANG